MEGDLERLLDVVALEVIRGVTGDSDIVVINNKLDIEAAGSSKASSLGVIALLLRTIGTKAPRDLVGVGHSNTVDHWPHLHPTTCPHVTLDLHHT